MLFSLLALPLLLSLAGWQRLAWLPVAGALALPWAMPVWAAPGMGWEVLPGLPLTLAVQTAREQGLMQVLLWVYLAVHAYSLFYVDRRTGTRRYFALLGLFLLGMATLMAAQSWLAILLGWEVIGLASFLLVAHYRAVEGVGRQATYVFWVNRVGDMALLAGVALALAHHPAAVYGLVLAATVKSVLVPFSLWVPWAMVGPTPVSALLHAATLVVSGVVLLTHPLLQPVLANAPALCQGLTLWAAATALVAALAACRAHNLKRLLAYSTLAHIALMMLWPYVDGGAAGLWHLGAHAFFKTGLFLALGLLHSYDHVLHTPWRTVYYTLKGNGWAAVAAIATVAFAAALIGLSPFAAHASKAALLNAQPGTAFFLHPWAMQGRVVLSLLYIGLTAAYSVRFLLGYLQSLAHKVPAGRDARRQTLILVALLPFLFWQPFDGGELPIQRNAWPSAAFLDVSTILFLLMALVWQMRHTVEVTPRLGLVPGLAAAGFVSRAMALIASFIGWLDGRWANFLVGVAEFQVVLAWLLHNAERAVLAIVHVGARIAVRPLRWLVDDRGRLTPGRMAWTALAIGLGVGFWLW